MANQKDVTPGQIALAWLLHKGNDIVPIPGTKHLRYLEENISASRVVLSTEEVTQLETSVGQVAGERKSAADMRFISRE